ncbi:MAG: ABC transporter permease, partial [Actinomycetota bacterium]|nr:ABC transporter permease [Actinomycetota bacterium]
MHEVPHITTGMMSAEVYKLKAHRTPLATLAVLLVGVLAAPAVLLFYTPADSSAYGEVWQLIYALLAPLTAMVFGGWLIGTEYRQGTLKRMLTTEPRRLRALGAKAAVGGAALLLGLAVAAAAGWGASWLVGSFNDAAVAFEGRDLLAAGVWALISAAVAFVLA